MSEKTKNLLFKLLTAVVIFGILFSLGYNNVRQKLSVSQIPSPPIPTPTDIAITSPEFVPKKTIIIKTIDPNSTVNIRQSASTNSKIISQAYLGEAFEYLSNDSDWYSVKLADGSLGFISAKFVDIYDQ